MSIDLQAAGWQPIPTGPVLGTLPTIGAAIRGGLFFTLSIGAGSALGIWALVRVIGHFFNAHRDILVRHCFHHHGRLPDLYQLRRNGMVPQHHRPRAWSLRPD